MIKLSKENQIQKTIMVIYIYQYMKDMKKNAPEQLIILVIHILILSYSIYVCECVMLLFTYTDIQQLLKYIEYYTHYPYRNVYKNTLMAKNK